jgi:hypothetical protein
MRSILLFVIVAGVSLLAPICYAQFTGDITGQGVSITLQPQYPNPGDTVTASIDDYAYGGGGGEIIWQRDGVELTDSKNQRTVTFTAGNVGEPMNISATVRFGNGQTFTAKQTITPNFLDIIIEPHTYTPVFYQGRGLPTLGSTVYVTALLSTGNGLVAASDYSYRWQLNGSSLQGGAVRGGYKTKIEIPYGLTSIVTVSVVDPAGNTVARGLVEIPSTDISIRFYEVSTLYGLMRKSIGEKLPFIGNSTTIRAVPYNLSLSSVDENLITKWSIDNREQSASAKDPFEINLRRGSGNTSQVMFTLQHSTEFLQSKESFTVNF